MKSYLKVISIILLALFFWGCQNTDWSAQEIKDLYAKYARTKELHGVLYYVGSDENYHYFQRLIYKDTWDQMRVKIKEIEIKNTKPYTSSAPFAYYAVNPLNGFEEIKKKD